MGGNAVFKGTDHQAASLVGVYVRILEGRPLDWLGATPDLPVAVAAETKGPGDDFRVEIEPYGKLGCFETQAKHTISGGKEMDAVLAAMGGRTGAEAEMPVVLAVGSGSSLTVRVDLREDLDRLRQGRTDVFHAEAQRILKNPANAELLARLHVVVADFDSPSDQARQLAVEGLTHLLADKDHASAAWDILYADAQDLCARRGRRTAEYLRNLLTTRKGFELRPPAPDEPFRHSLEIARHLRAKGRVGEARSVLDLSLGRMETAGATAAVRLDTEVEAAKCCAQDSDSAKALEHAQAALAINPTYGPAAAVAAAVTATMGDRQAAERWAAVACADARTEGEGWQALTVLDRTQKRQLRAVPQRVAESAKYRLLLAGFAAEDGDVQRCLRITAELIAEGNREPILLLLRCQALRQAAEAATAADKTTWTEVESLATQLLDATGEAPRYAGLAFAARGRARQAMGRAADGDADLERAEVLSPGNLDLIRDLVNARMAAGDREGAVRVLRTVRDDPRLLSWRGSILAELGHRDEARRDLETALLRAGDSSVADDVRHYAASGFMIMGLAEEAEKALKDLSQEATDGYFGRLDYGRLAVLQGDPDLAVASYREAASLTADARSVLGELAVNLVAKHFFPQAVALFVEVGTHDDEERRAYTEALLRTGDLARARAVVDSVIAAESPSPTWTLAAAAEIEQRQGDAPSMIADLSELAARGGATPAGRLALASLLLEEDRPEDARTQIEALESMTDLAPAHRIRLAVLLRAIGRPMDAVILAFGAHRALPTDPDIQRTFASMFFTSGLPEITADRVGPDTFVQIEVEPGKELAYTVLDAGADPTRGEMNVAEADALGLLGKRVDEAVPGLQSHSHGRAVPTVRKVTPSIARAALDIMEKFGDWFPSQPYFAEAIKIGDGMDPVGLATMVSVVQGQRGWIEKATAVWREGQLPLGFLAVAAHRLIRETMDYVSGDPGRCGPLRVEGQSPGDCASSRAAALRGGPVVLTQSALRTAQGLGLLDGLAAGFDLVAPRSLLVELRRAVREATKEEAEGVKTMTSETPVGFGIYDLPAGHPSLIKRRDEARSLYEWLGDSARIEPRPLATIGPFDSDPEKIREWLGPESVDAVALAAHLGATLYADDHGLRRYEWREEVRVASFSTFGLLAALVDRGRVEASTRNRYVVDLLLANYVHAQPTSEILEEATCRLPALNRPDLGRVFATLGNPDVGGREVAAIAVTAIKRIAMRPIAPLTSIEAVIELAVAGMASGGRPPAMCATLISRRAQVDLLLLPALKETVQRICARVSQQS
jgi:tetratricopeptide (TPR) repeat protein